MHLGLSVRSCCAPVNLSHILGEGLHQNRGVEAVIEELPRTPEPFAGPIASTETWKALAGQHSG